MYTETIHFNKKEQGTNDFLGIEHRIQFISQSH